VKFVLHPGALTYPRHLPDPSRQPDLLLDSLRRLDSTGLDVLIENMTPYAWFLAGDWSPRQGVSNSFLAPGQLADFLGTYGYGMCLDLCHAKLYCNASGTDLLSYMRTVQPFVRHIHFSDCTGIDGEGVQVGDGEIDWQEVCEVFAEHEHGWTPEIWNGHHDRGEKFCAAHRNLSREFARFRSSVLVGA
jgi:N-acetylneuraminate synthase